MGNSDPGTVYQYMSGVSAYMYMAVVSDALPPHYMHIWQSRLYAYGSRVCTNIVVVSEMLRTTGSLRGQCEALSAAGAALVEVLPPPLPHSTRNVI